MMPAERPVEIMVPHRMESLPPVEDAPILAEYERLGVEAFQEAFALETPLYKNGTVNHHQLVRVVKNLVRPDYHWEAPFFDEHHLYWPGADYELPTIQYEGVSEASLYEKGGNKLRYFEASVLHEDGLEAKRVTRDENEIFVDRLFSEYLDISEFEHFSDEAERFYAIASAYRELAMNKLWVPRQFHNFIHAVTRPPEMPELSVMTRAVRNALRREYLFRVATSAYTITEKLDRAEPLSMPGGLMALIDRKDRRIYHNPQDMESRRVEFIEVLIRSHQEGIIDLTRLAPIEVVDDRSVEEALGVIASRMSNTGLVKTRHNSKAWRVELLTKNRAHSVLLRGEDDTNLQERALA